jgi:exodeoxyribonuclease VIII
MRDVMVDLETMGNGPRAAIVAIGAVAFDLVAGIIGERFYKVVDLDSAVHSGGEMDAGTVLWWLQQSDAARAAIASGGETLYQVLSDFALFAYTQSGADELRVWGNGAAFDNVILSSAFDAVNIPRPWSYRNDRCYRTVKEQFPQIRIERVGEHHHALADAESQARHLIAIMKGVCDGV